MSSSLQINREQLRLLSLKVLHLKPERFFLIQSQKEFLLAWTVKNTPEKSKHDLTFPRINYRNFSLTNPEIQDYEPDYFIHLRNNEAAETNLSQEEIINIERIILPRPQVSKFFQKEEIPDKKHWIGYCEKIQKAIACGELQKLVPARSKKFICENEISSVGALRSLFLKFENVKELHLFCIGENDFTFIGASPELLFRKKKNEIFIHAVAGTKKRNIENIEDDKALAQELLQSKKELAEHKIVVDFLIERIAKIAKINSSQKELLSPQILKLPTLQHLYTPITAELFNEVNGKKNHALDIISLLHPTPAMCGFPQERAAQFIEENEGWQRGLFSAPLGYYYENKAKFIVGIRSALIEGKKLQLFAGAGFVEGSSAESEWNETDQKMRSLEEVFAVDI